MEGVSVFYVLFYQFPIALSKTLITLQLLYELFIMSLIAWLITLQCKIPVTAGPINPKLPTNLKSARLQM